MADAPALATARYSVDFGGGVTATLTLRALRNDGADDPRIEYSIELDGPRPRDREGRARLKDAAEIWVNQCVALFSEQLRARTRH